MGLYRTDYIVYGWKSIPTIDIWDEKFTPYVEGHRGVKYCIVQGENHKNTVFGYKLAIASEDWSFKDLNFDITNRSLNEELINKYIELFGREPDEDPTMFIFSNYQ